MTTHRGGKSSGAVASTRPRNRYALTRGQLLEDYAARSLERTGTVAASATRHRSSQYLDVLAAQATGDGQDWADLRSSLQQEIQSGAPQADRDELAEAEIGRILLLRPNSRDDVVLGVFMLESAVRKMDRSARSRRFRLMLTQQYIVDGRLNDAEECLNSWHDIKRIENGYLLGELRHPFRGPERGSFNLWLDHFNASFEAHGLMPIELDGQGKELFDQVSVSVDPGSEVIMPPDVGRAGPTVSVVMTAFKPETSGLITSVRSILNQTIQSIELVLVDDGSGSDYADLFARVKAMDGRINLVTLTQNQGAYAARNRGYAATRGEYITGQDDDDWSHPERLERQVSYMRRNPDTAGCRISAIMCDSSLSRLRLGYRSINANASSLMIRREQFFRAGRYIEIAKAADAEFMHRLERLYGSQVTLLREPLSLVRIHEDSLSRSDFAVGWNHPARRQFKSSYYYWHDRSADNLLSIGAEASPRVSVPRRFQTSADVFVDRFDVIVAADWRESNADIHAIVSEIEALSFAGYGVAILHLESPRVMTTTTVPMAPDIQHLVNDGTVSEVLYDDPVKARLLIIHDPSILQFMPDQPSAIDVAKVLVVADAPPSRVDGFDVWYLVRDCFDNATRAFSSRVTWVPRSPQVREAISPYLSACDLEEFDLLSAICPKRWSVRSRERSRSSLPVVGRLSADREPDWPERATTIELAYPTDGSLDIRVMGGVAFASQILGRENAPPAWIAYPEHAFSAREFLDSLDFYVYFRSESVVDGVGRSVLEAIASGLIVVLPPSYASLFKGAALYAHPENVAALVHRYHADRSLFVEQQQRAAEVLSREFSYGRFARRIDRVLESLPGRG